MPEQELKVDSYIEFNNEQAQQLGMPMPAGTVRVYQLDQPQESENRASGLKFIGEDRIKHTPANAKVRLKTGQVFRLKCNAPASRVSASPCTTALP